ncbi:dsDNA nuclease domain-containing protein [Virgibacillus halophilus]|uniref:dsDNA nuclease domain-containing protein n=1 Tax=Tigheibacillus halophilus TaxID=361280 RepID=UPI00362939C1
MDKLKDSFVKPRDTSGPRSSNRFDYQKDWAILKMMEMYEVEEDFLLVMDYYDDVVVYDSATDLENISFSQIKTSSKNWTLNSLTKRKPGAEGSCSY